MQKPPFFILGVSRSGTTLLRLMLASHKNLAVPPEGGFVVRLGWKYGHRKSLSIRDVRRFVQDLFLLETTQDWEFDETELRTNLERIAPCSYPTLVDGVYREYIRRKFPGAARWGDKTTWYLDYLHQLMDYFPEAQFLHLLRDGRAVAASFKGVPHLSDDVGRAALEWAWGVEAITRFGKQLEADRYMEVKYECLVEDPEDELRCICDFLREPYDAGMLEFWSKNRQQELEPKRHLEWKALTLDQVTTSRVNHWQVELGNHELAEFYALAGITMKTSGYTAYEGDLPYVSLLRLAEEAMLYKAGRTVKRALRPWKERLVFR